MRRLALAAALATGTAAAEPLVIDPDAHFPEGPAVVGDALYYVEYAGQTLMRWDGAGAPVEVWRRDGCGPSAALPFQGDFLVTCYDSGEIARVSADGETVAVVAEDRDGAPFVGPNDFTADGRGGAYMTASGPWDSAPIAGVVYHIAADMTVRAVADDLHYANGIALAPGGGTLYVAESEAARIVTLDVAEDGSLSNRRLFVRIGQVDAASGPWAYPDGIEIGPDGALWIGSYAAGRLVAVTAEGTLARTLEVPGATAPNLAFAPDGRAAYVMTVDQTDAAPYAGRVLRIALD